MNLIMWGVSSAGISIMWNDSKMPSFVPQRGSSPRRPSFTIYICSLHGKIGYPNSEVGHEGKWNTIRVTKEGVGISHLFFAEDVLLFCQPSKEQMQLVAKTLEDFYNEG